MRRLPASRGSTDMARSIEAGLSDVQIREQGLRVLARMIARVYGRDARLGANYEPEHGIPCCGGTKIGHFQIEKTEVKRSR